MSFIGKPLIKEVASKIDDLIKLKGIAEMLDGALIKFALNALDDRFADKVPVMYQDEVIILLEAFVSDDYSKVTDATVSTLNELIDIPVLNEDEEAILVGGVVQIISRLILKRKK